MALVVKGAVPPPSINKGGYKHPKNILIPKDKQCYCYERGEGSKAFVLKPLIDYLTITVPIGAINCMGTDTVHTDAEDHQGLLLSAVQEYLQSETNPNWVPFNKKHLPAHIRNQYMHYKASARLADLPGLAAIQVGPNNKTHFFMRITIVPSSWDASHVARFWEQLGRLAAMPDFKDWVVEHGRIRRVDYAVDILNADASDLLLRKPMSVRKSFGYFGANGGVESWYIGNSDTKASSKGSTAYLYDKKAQTEAQGLPACHGGVLHSRCEFRVRFPGKSAVSMAKLAKPSGKLKNRFQDYSVTDFFAASPSENEARWHFFGDSCRVRGFEQALDMLPPQARAAFVQAFNAATQICWRPADLWSSAPECAKFLIGH